MVAPKIDSGAALGFFWEVFRARPMVYIGLGVWWLVVALFLGVGQIAWIGDDMAAMQAASTAGSDDLPGLMGTYFGKLILFALLGIAISVPLEAAWLRLFMSGEGNPVFPFRLGPAEGAYALSFLVLIVAAILFFIVTIGIGIGLMLLIAGAMGESGAILGAVLIYVLMAAAYAVFGTRISPIFALAVHRRKFTFARAWNGTKNMFWPLLGCFIIAVLIMLVAYVAGMIAFLFMGVDMEQMATGIITAEWQALIAPYAVLYLFMFIPTCMFRGIACKAALTIEEANAAPPPVEAGGTIDPS